MTETTATTQPAPVDTGALAKDILIEAFWPLTVAFIGYLIVHLLNSWRERIAKRREMRTKFLIDAYSKLARIVLSTEWKFDDLRTTLADIQLLGTASQISIANNLVRTIPGAFQGDNQGAIDLEPLLQNMRRDLRKELSMEKIDDTFWWLRTDGKPSTTEK